jgi:hypothetical protein
MEKQNDKSANPSNTEADKGKMVPMTVGGLLRFAMKQTNPELYAQVERKIASWHPERQEQNKQQPAPPAGAGQAAAPDGEERVVPDMGRAPGDATMQQLLPGFERGNQV